MLVRKNEKRKINQGYIESVEQDVSKGGLSVTVHLPIASAAEARRILGSLREHRGKYVELSRWVDPSVES